MDGIPRRALLKRALQVAGGLALAAQVVPRAAAAGSCADPASESLRTSMHYASASSSPEQICGKCAFFTRDANGAGCGACVIMSGPVDEKGHCDSWSAPG